MKLSLFLSMLVVFSVAGANVKETTETKTESANIQLELLNELNSTPEDLEFDVDDELSDGATFTDADIEKIALTEKEEAAKEKATTTPTKIKK